MKSNKLKEVRTERGMSITELAKRSKLSRATVSNVEKGYSNPTILTVAAICKALGRSPDDIFFAYDVNHEEHKGERTNDKTKHRTD